MIPAKGHSYVNGKCTVCGAIDPDFKPVIITGANGSWRQDETGDLGFRSDAAFADFLKVQVDGNDLDPAYYTAQEGRTSITLKKEYLQTLSTGVHTLSIFSTTGTASTNFTIQAVQTVSSSAAAATPTLAPSYYTCTACGYHNWTATDAGYR